MGDHLASADVTSANVKLAITCSSLVELILFIIPILLLALELVSWRYASLGAWGNYLWVLSFLFPLTFLLREFFRLGIAALQLKAGFTFAVVIFLACLFFQRLNSFDTIRIATGEIQCVLGYLDSAADAGFHQTCNWGNPSRQFLLPAIPSMILPRGELALAIGYSIYYVLGLIAFASGAWAWLKQNPGKDILVATTLLLLLHLAEFWRYACNYEQVNFPACFALLLIGFLFHYLAAPTMLKLGNLGILILHSAFAYHPSLALFIGAVATLAFLVLTQKVTSTKERNYIAIFSLIAAGLFISSLQYRTLQIVNHARIEVALSDRIRTFFDILVWQQGPHELFSTLLLLLSLATIALCLLGALGFAGFLTGIWILLVFLFSLFSKGNWDYEIINSLRVDRANVAAPIILGLFLGLNRKIKLSPLFSKIIYFPLFITVALNGLQVFTLSEERKSNDDGRIILELQDYFGAEVPFTLLREFILPEWESGQFVYLVPHSQQVRLSEDCAFDLPQSNFAFLLSAKGQCAKIQNDFPNWKSKTVQLDGEDFLLLLPRLVSAANAIATQESKL